jgi:hypothetical protein
MAQGEGPEVKPQYSKQKKKEKEKNYFLLKLSKRSASIINVINYLVPY